MSNSFIFSINKEDLREATHLSVDQEVIALDDGADPKPLSEPAVLLESDANNVVGQACCLAYEDCLRVLATSSVPNTCSKCGQLYSVVTSRIGTALYMTWVSVLSGSKTSKLIFASKLLFQCVYLPHFFIL